MEGLETVRICSLQALHDSLRPVTDSLRSLDSSRLSACPKQAKPTYTAVRGAVG